MDIGDRPDTAELSHRLGTEVQRFSTYRSGELHGWERATDGLLTRAFAYAGQTVTRWMGTPCLLYTSDAADE